METKLPHLSWQHQVHLPIRRYMMKKLMEFMQSQEQSRNGSAILKKDWFGRLPFIVRRLELALYVRAASVKEYINEHTLCRRVQYLIRHLHYRGLKERGISMKRKQIRKAKVLHKPIHSNFMFENQKDVLRSIYSYLDGKDVIRQRVLCKFASDFLPSCVRQLKVDLKHADSMCASLKSYTNLESLRIVNKNGRANTLPFGVIGDGEECMNNVASVLEMHCNSKLKKLVFMNVVMSSANKFGICSLMHALKNKACPQLQQLVLSGNALGDVGISSVVEYLKTNNSLKILDLQDNHIGEYGFTALSNAFAASDSCSIEQLHLGSNVATDQALHALIGALALYSLPKLRILGLEDNFIEYNGVHSLAKMLRQHVCPHLVEVCIGGNVVDNATIHAVFYQENT